MQVLGGHLSPEDESDPAQGEVSRKISQARRNHVHSVSYLRTYSKYVVIIYIIGAAQKAGQIFLKGKIILRHNLLEGPI